MNLPYYKSKDNNLYTNYMNNYIDSNENKLYIQNIKEISAKKKNSVSNLNKNKLSFNNYKSNNKSEYLIYKSVLGGFNNQLSISNSSKNNDVHIYDTYNNIKDKSINNIITKNNFNNIYMINNNSNKKILSQSTNKYDNNNYQNTNNSFKYSILNSKNENISKKNDQFYSSSDSFYKNYYDSKNTSYNKIGNNYQVKMIVKI